MTMSSGVVRIATDPALLERDAAARVNTAWRELSGGSLVNPPLALRGPRDEGKSVVFALGPVGPGGRGVVAKELLSQAAAVELAAYNDVLPALSLRGPDVLGWVDSSSSGKTWLFLDEITGPLLDKTDPAQVAVASRWLGAFHAGTASLDIGRALPERDPDYYSSLISGILTELGVLPANPAIKRSHLAVLSRVSSLLAHLQSQWPAVADILTALPGSVAHGDFKPNNMAFSGGPGQGHLRVFDWSEAHRGPWATDLTWVDLLAYRNALADQGLEFEVNQLEGWRAVGDVLRWTLAISWEIPGLKYEWIDRGMGRMMLYEQRLRAAIAGCVWH